MDEIKKNKTLKIKPIIFKIMHFTLLAIALVPILIWYFQPSRIGALSETNKVLGVFYIIIFSELIVSPACWIIEWLNVLFLKKRYLNNLFSSYWEGKKILESKKVNPKVLILYPTCDDFIAHCADKCLMQTYKNQILCILDDSKTKEYQDIVDEYAKNNSVIVYRRPVKHGYKGGNICDFLKHYENKWDYYVIVDADTLLPSNFVEQNVCLFLSPRNANIGYIQSSFTAYYTKSLYSRIVRDRINCICDITGIKGYFNLDSKVHYIDWGTMISKKLWDEVDSEYDDVVNCDTWFGIKFYQTKYDSLYSVLTPVSSMEPLDEIAFYNREKRWWLAQVEIYRKIQFTTLYNKNKTFAQNLAFASGYPQMKLFKIAFGIVFSTLLLPFLCMFFVGVYSTLAIVLWIALAANFLIALISMLRVAFRYKNLLLIIKYFSGMSIYAANCFKVAWIFVARLLFHITSKVNYYISSKTYKKLSFKSIISFNKINLIVFTLALVSIILFIVYRDVNFAFFIGAAITLSVFAIQFFILIISTFLSNITIKKNDAYEYDPFYKYTKWRKKYNVPLEK